MTTITAAELAAMRAVADDFLPDTCTIQTVTASQDALGGVTDSYASTYTGVACRLDPSSGGEGISNNVIEGQSRWMLNIPYDPAISVNNRVVHESKTYEVAYVWDTHSYSTIRRAELVRVD